MKPDTLAAFNDLFGRPLISGSWVHLMRWPFEEKRPELAPLNECYLWRVQETKPGKLELVAYGAEKRVLLNERRARVLIAFAPSIHLVLSEFPVEWARWRESGWGLHIQDVPMGFTLHSTKYGTTAGGGLMREYVMEEITKEDLRYWLMESLYSQVHRRKSAKQEREGDEVGRRQAVEEFVKKMERREAKGLSSFEKEPSA